MRSTPHGVHDDQVDATTQALNYLREGPYTEPPPIAVLRQDRINAAAALVHPVTGYERGTAAQGGLNISHQSGEKSRTAGDWLI
jgi:hypothetical protein